MIFFTRHRFHTAADIHTIRSHGTDGVGDIAGGEATGEQDGMRFLRLLTQGSSLPPDRFLRTRSLKRYQ